MLQGLRPWQEPVTEGGPAYAQLLLSSLGLRLIICNVRWNGKAEVRIREFWTQIHNGEPKDWREPRFWSQADPSSNLGFSTHLLQESAHPVPQLPCLLIWHNNPRFSKLWWTLSEIKNQNLKQCLPVSTQGVIWGLGGGSSLNISWGIVEGSHDLLNQRLHLNKMPRWLLYQGLPYRAR